MYPGSSICQERGQRMESAMKKLTLIAVLLCTLQASPSFAQSGRIGAPWLFPSQDGDSLGPPAGCSLAPPVTPAFLMVPPPEPVLPPRPPTPVRPVLHEYQWPAPPSPQPNPGTFLLVLTDSTVRRAIALWQQDGTLHFLFPDHTSGAVRLDAIDREATRRLNADRGLTLALPANPHP